MDPPPRFWLDRGLLRRPQRISTKSEERTGTDPSPGRRCGDIALPTRGGRIPGSDPATDLPNIHGAADRRTTDTGSSHTGIPEPTQPLWDADRRPRSPGSAWRSETGTIPEACAWSGRPS